MICRSNIASQTLVDSTLHVQPLDFSETGCVSIPSQCIHFKMNAVRLGPREDKFPLGNDLALQKGRGAVQNYKVCTV